MPDDRLEITVHEDPVTAVWRFEIRGHQVEVERAHGFVKIDGQLHETNVVKGLEDVDDLAGEPLDEIRRLIPVPEANLPTAEPQPAEQEPAPASGLRNKSAERREDDQQVTAQRKPEAATGEKTSEPEKTSADEEQVSEGSPYLTTPQAAAYLHLRPSTLERWRCVGGGPMFVKIGARVFYRREDLERFVEERRRKSTSDPGDAGRTT